MSSVGAPDVRKLIQSHEKDIVNALSTTDLLKLSKDLFEHLVIDKQDYTTFTTLDHDNLNSQTTARYLLGLVVEVLGKNDCNAYSGFTRVLSGKGGTCMQVAKRLHHVAKPNTPQGLLLETDVDFLIESLITCSYKWEELGIMLGLPKHVLEECKSEKSNALKLHKILIEWLTGSYPHAKLSTLENLKAALESDMVACKNLCVGLEDKYQCHMQTRNVNFDSTSSPELDAVPLQMVYQSSDTQIADHKSALLEVRVKSSEPVNYQWMRDGEPLSDNSLFSGTTGPILLIKQATLGTEGEYCCQVRCGHKQLATTPVTFKIKYSPDKNVLISLYSKYSEVPRSLWPITTSNAFVDLALVEIKKMKSHGSILIAEEMESAMIEHEKVEYDDVFGKYREGEIVLVEGRPGSGKTTLAHKIVRDWSQGKALRSADNVFLVSLRRNFSKPQIFYFFYHSQSKQFKLKVEKTSGEKVCFLLDGYDEFNSKNDSSSIIEQLIHKTYLPQSMVIITSRPEASYEMRQYASTRIEILGFTRNSFYHYIDNYPLEIKKDFQEEEKTRIQFRNYVESCTNILNICYLPINASTICFLFSQFSGTVQPPKTESKIYEMLVVGIILHQLRSQDPKAQLYCLKDLSVLDKQIFQEICSLAFHMTTTNKQTEDQLPVHYATLFKCCMFRNLFVVDHAVKICGIEEVFSFTHLTLQEYLAAYYLASLDDDQQLGVINKYTRKNYMCTTLKFYCGMINYETKIEQCQALFSLIPRRNMLHHIHCAYESQQRKLCKVAVSLIGGKIQIDNSTLTPADFTALEYVLLNVPQDITEVSIQGCRLYTVSVEYLSRKSLNTKRFLDEHMNTCSTDELEHFRYIQMEQYLKVSYKIDPLLYYVDKSFTNSIFLSEYRNNLNFHVDASLEDKEMRANAHIKDRRFDSGYADKFIAAFFQNCNKLNEVTLSNNLFWINNPRKVAMHPNNTSLKVLSLSNVKMSFIETLGRGLKCCQNLETLKLFETPINYTGVAALADGLQHCMSLNDIHLSMIDMGTEGLKVLAKGLKKTPLKKVRLDTLSVSNEGASTLVSEGCFKQVQELTLMKNNIKCISFMMSDQVLNKDLYSLKLAHNYLNSVCVIDLVKQLKKCSLLRVLNLAFNPVGRDGAAALGKGLNCTKLNILLLMGCNITSNGMPGLIIGFYHWKGLTHLDLTHNHLCSNAMPALVKGLRMVPSLTKLYIAQNDIDHKGARALAKGIQYCLQLEVFNISHNSIGSVGAAALTKALKCNQIKFLDFSHNSIGPNNETLLINLVSLAKRNYISYISETSLIKTSLLSLNDLAKGYGIGLLDLCNNNLGTDITISLIIHLIFTHNPNILNLSNNNTSEDVPNLVKALNRVLTIQTIYP